MFNWVVTFLVIALVAGILGFGGIAGASIETLRLQVSALRDETARLQRANETLLTRFALQEKSGGELVRRVGALEVSVPRMLEDLPATTLVDMSSQTASIGTDPPTMWEAEGGSVSVRQVPIPGAVPPQPLPEPVSDQPAAATALAQPNDAAYGLAVGAAVPSTQAEALWTDLTVKLGPLLFGMTPLLADASTGEDKRIVVGPIDELSQATSLCARFERVSIACAPVPYEGTPLQADVP